MKYQLEIYVEPRINKHHPQGGWFKNGLFNTREEAQVIIDRSNMILDRINKRHTPSRIIEVNE